MLRKIIISIWTVALKIFSFYSILRTLFTFLQKFYRNRPTGSGVNGCFNVGPVTAGPNDSSIESATAWAVGGRVQRVSDWLRAHVSARRTRRGGFTGRLHGSGPLDRLVHKPPRWARWAARGRLGGFVAETCALSRTAGWKDSIVESFWPAVAVADWAVHHLQRWPVFASKLRIINFIQQ